MRGRWLVLSAAIAVVVFVSYTNTGWSQSTEDLIKEMQAQIKDLQTRLDKAEAKNSELESRLGSQEQTMTQQSENLVTINKHITQREGAEPTVFDKYSFGGGGTGIFQGTTGNDDNVGGDGDVTDASWSGDFEVQALMGEHGSAFVAIEAGEGDGLQDDEVVTFHGTNGDSGNNDAFLEITEAWYNHMFLDHRLEATIGKIDVTNYTDGNAAANDETLQFLSGGFVNSVAVEWPDDNGLGMRTTLHANDLIDLSVAWAEADAEYEDFFDDGFAIAEVDFMPVIGEDLQGNYRLYTWYNGTDKENLKDPSDDEEGGYGVGFSGDQQLCGWATIFARLGRQDDDVYEVEWAWSSGVEFGMSALGREKDVLALAFGEAVTNDELDLENEDHVEAYYRWHLTDYMEISPNVQYFWNPLGEDDAEDFAVIGARVQVTF